MQKNSSSKKWSDIKVMIAAISVTATLGLWNLFASRAALLGGSQVVEVPAQPAMVTEPVVMQNQPSSFFGKLLLGGAAPQTRLITRSSGGGGGAQAFTQTRSS